MNWTELRPKLRKQYGNQFGFFNDKRRNGSRRVKIYGVNKTEIKQFILKQDPNISVHEYTWAQYCASAVSCVVVYFNE